MKTTPLRYCSKFTLLNLSSPRSLARRWVFKQNFPISLVGGVSWIRSSWSRKSKSVTLGVVVLSKFCSNVMLVELVVGVGVVVAVPVVDVVSWRWSQMVILWFGSVGVESELVGKVTVIRGTAVVVVAVHALV